MGDEPERPIAHRTLLAVLAACCVGPMLLIVVLTSVVGLTIGVAAALSIGVVAAIVCVGAMVLHHRGGAHQAPPHR